MALRAARDPSGRVRQTWQKRFAVDRVFAPAIGRTLADEFDIVLPCNDCTLSPSEVTMQWDLTCALAVDVKHAGPYLMGNAGYNAGPFNDPYRCILHEARLMDWVGFLQEGKVVDTANWRQDQPIVGPPNPNAGPNTCTTIIYAFSGAYTAAFTQPQQLRSTPQLRFTATVGDQAVQAFLAGPPPTGTFGTQKSDAQMMCSRVTGTVTISAIV
jgi:hypothetical protein